MIKFLLPSQLVAETPDEPGASPYAGALNAAFRAAYPLVKSAAWRSLPISLFGLLPSIFLLQVYDRVLSRSGTSTLAALVSGILFFLCIEFWLRTRRSRLLRNAGAIVDHGVSGALLNSMLGRPLRALEARPASVWHLYFRDVASVRGTITGGLAQSIFDLPMAVFALVVIGIVALPVLRGHRHWNLRMAWRGKERDIRTPTLFVGNNPLQLHQVGIPEADAPEQGQLAAIVLKPVGPLAMPGLLVRGALGRLGDADEVLTFPFESS